MRFIKRILDIKLPQKQSAFLLGSRKTGKTTYLKKNFPDSLIFDFLKTDFFIEVSKNPALLRERILAKVYLLTLISLGSLALSFDLQNVL